MVVDPLGKLYNKDAIIEYLIDKSSYGDGEMICPYVNGVKVSPLAPLETTAADLRTCSRSTSCRTRPPTRARHPLSAG